MDLQYGDRPVHLPGELIDLVVSHLRTANDLGSARLINRTFYQAATAVMLDIRRSPSELFTYPTRAVVEEIERAKPVNDIREPWSQISPVTIWTTLTVPLHVPLEHQDTELGRKFFELVTSGSYVMDSDTDPRLDYHSQYHGRKGVCWGRVEEGPSRFWIVMQWRNRACWNAYRISDEAAKLRAFLRALVPGCASSVSEYVPLPRMRRLCDPLVDFYAKVRTVYFNASMSAEQKAALEYSPYVRTFTRIKRVSRGDFPNVDVDDPCCVACWLPGLRLLEGKLVVAALVVSARACEGHWSLRKKVTSEAGFRTVTQGELLEEDLRRAGMVGSEDFHCDFHGGPFDS